MLTDSPPEKETEPTSGLMTAKQCAKKLAVPVAFIHNAARTGECPSIYINRFMFSMPAVEAWLHAKASTPEVPRPVKNRPAKKAEACEPVKVVKRASA